MKIFVSFLLILGIFCVLSQFAQAQEVPEFTVVSIVPPPDSLVPRNLSEIKIVFSDEVVAEDQVGVFQDVTQASFRIMPHLPGQFQWIDKKTLLFKPKGALKEATAYTFRFHDDFANMKGKLLSGRHDFSFKTAPLEVKTVKQVDYSPKGSIVIEIDFSLPVLPQKLRGFLTLKDARGREIPYNLPLGPPNTQVFITTAALQSPTIFLEIAAGLTSERGPLGLEQNYVKKIEALYELQVTGSYTYSFGTRQTIIFLNTSTPLEPRTLQSFIQIDPPIPFITRATPYGFEIQGDFAPRSRIVVTLKKGLTSRTGAKLKEDFVKAFIIPDVYPSITFPTQGIYLSPVQGARIPIETVNVNRVKLSLWKIYENNLPLVLAEVYGIPPDILSELVYEKVIFNDAPPNVISRKAIDLENLTDQKRGAYLLIAEDETQSWVRAEQIVVLTDIAPTVKLFPQGMLLWVNSLKSGQALSGAEVKVLSRANQVLAQGICDQEGMLFIQRDEPWGEGNLAPYLVTISWNGDTSFLLLQNELFALSGFDITGKEYLRRGYEVFLYLPRGVFRPGERLDAKAILRAPLLNVPPPFPLLFTIITPFGRTLVEKTALLSEEGGAALDFILPENASTGTYRIRCALPGSKDQPLAEKTFLVEEFTPPRMRLTLSCKRDFLIPNESVDIILEGEYLFGAKASQIPYTGEVFIEPTTFEHPNWQGFHFGNREIEFTALKFPLGEGALDENGRGLVGFTVPSDLVAPSALKARFTITLNDPAGRAVSQHLVLPLYPYSFFVGIKYIPQDHEPGQPINFQIAAVTPEGLPKKDLPFLTARVYRVIQHYVLSESEGKTRYRLEEELSLEREETFSLVQGMGKYSFTPPDYGSYLVEVFDSKTGSTASWRFTVYGKYKLLPQGEALFDRVNLVTDKERYLPGEEATVAYQTPFPGKALLTIETDRILWQKVMEIEEEQGTISIPVTEAMIPNAYFSITMVRKNQQPTSLPQRALGTAPIFTDRKNTVLQVSIETPEHVRPKTILPVKIKVHNSSSKPVSGAELSLTLVDVGLLQLTAEKTPDPWNFFNEKRRLTVGTFDPYSDLITPEVVTTPLLHPAGGEAAEFLKAEFAPLRPRTFQIVSFFLPTLKTNEEGVVETQLQLPDFDGRLRIIVVAMKGENFGSGETDILCRDPIVTEVVAPRAVAPRDTFEIILSLFSQVEYAETVHVALSTNGLLELRGPQEFTVEIPRGGKVVRFLPVKVKDLLGEGVLTVKTTFSGGEREDRASFAIRPITPRIPLFDSGSIQPSERKRIDLPSDWLPGSVQGYITISPSPKVDLTRPAEMLFEYPYGCLEQIVSSAWGLLLLPDLLQDVDPLLANETEVRNAMERRIRRILSMQTYKGDFSVWPGYSESRLWDSVYATHFLQEAKKRGWEIPEGSLQGARNFLLTLLALQPYSEEEGYLRELFSAQSYAAYVLTLSGEAPLAWMEHLRERKKFLYDSGLLLLALAYAQAGQKEVAQELVGGYTPIPEIVSQTGDIYESSLRQIALHLLLSLELDPSSAQATNIVNTMRSRLAKTEHLSTQESAFVIMALEKYFEGQKFIPYITFTLYDTVGKELRQFTNQEKVTLNINTLPLSFQIENQTSAKLFYLWSVDGIPATPKKPWERGITVERIYLDENGELKDPKSVQSGEMLQVLIRISSGQTLENVVIVDPLPGGVEIENPRLATSAVYEEKAEESPVHFEIRDDRIIIFVPIILQEFEYCYTVRAITAGDFALPQIKAECMYNPAISALGEEGRVVIRRE